MDGTQEYRIEHGDTLSELALRFGVTIGALMRANDITDPHRIYAGDALKIPAQPAATPDKPA